MQHKVTSGSSFLFFDEVSGRAVMCNAATYSPQRALHCFLFLNALSNLNILIETTEKSPHKTNA